MAVAHQAHYVLIFILYGIFLYSLSCINFTDMFTLCWDTNTIFAVLYICKIVESHLNHWRWWRYSFKLLDLAWLNWRTDLTGSVCLPNWAAWLTWDTHGLVTRNCLWCWTERCHWDRSPVVLNLWVGTIMWEFQMTVKWYIRTCKTLNVKDIRSDKIRPNIA